MALICGNPGARWPKSVFSSETTHQVLTMMEAVVADGTWRHRHEWMATASAAKPAQPRRPVPLGYGTGRITSFVGIVPVD